MSFPQFLADPFVKDLYEKDGKIYVRFINNIGRLEIKDDIEVLIEIDGQTNLCKLPKQTIAHSGQFSIEVGDIKLKPIQYHQMNITFMFQYSVFLSCARELTSEDEDLL